MGVSPKEKRVPIRRDFCGGLESSHGKLESPKKLFTNTSISNEFLWSTTG
jgi:hypothetical protein